MKAKTVLQTRVSSLSKELPTISEEEKEYVFTNYGDLFFVKSRNTMFCLECGHEWKHKSKTPKHVVCPACNTKLKECPDYSRRWRSFLYYAIITTCAEFQLIRYFVVEKSCKKKHAAHLFISEVCQFWIQEDGKMTAMAKSVLPFSYFYDNWRFESDLVVKSTHYNSCQRALIYPYLTFPKRKIKSFLRRNGFKYSFHGTQPQRLFPLLLKDPKAEILIKNGYGYLLHNYMNHPNNFDIFWKSLRIVMKNNYQIKSPSDYFDYLKFLKYLDLDLLNPHYICPENFKAAHDLYRKKKRKKEDAIEYKEQRIKNLKKDAEYTEQKSKFFDIHIQSGDIEITPLKSIQDFIEEEDALHHCVYSSEYFSKKDSLILSAMVNNKKTETIELSLSKLSVLQSRGLQNQPTKFHSEILSVINEHIGSIAAIK